MKYDVIATGSKGNAENEIWRDVTGFGGFYQISSYGRLKSYKKYSSGRIIKLTEKTGRYFAVVLSYAGKTRSVRVHRLVAETFIPNPFGLPQVNHKDGNKQNNRVDNLEWCTASYNVRHSMKMNPTQCAPMIYYNKHVRPIPVQMLDKNGAVLRVFSSGAEASASTGICHRNILQVCNGERNEHGYLRKSAGGYIWRFEREVM